MPVRNPEDMEVTEEETVTVETQQSNNTTATSTTTSALDEDNYFEPIDYSKVGTYFVKEFDENTGKARWNIPNIAKLPQKQYCEEFEIAGCPWRLLMFPRGNNVQSISIYLDVPDARQQSATWTRYARFQISIINHKDPKKSASQEAEKRFNSQETDWGFREFLPLSKLTVEEGFINESGFVVIECVVNVCKDPFLLNPASYDSKKETGFVGVKNQGATCYMNSLLQSWFHITFLRKAVYKMPIEENEVPTSSIPLALQRLFYNLQSEKNAVDTKELTKSFGWDTIDSFLQHDIQELARVLTDNLEKKMDKTPAKGTMKYLFEGSIKNYIKCLNVNYESSRVETFYDITLNLKGCKDVLASFKHYIQDEMLAGENQYHAEGHGLQDAKKGCIFMKFPPVLTLHLERFAYDIQRDCMYKVNDRYEFPTVMDLNPFIAPESEFYGKDNTYTLFSVLVHSGNVDGGHYFAFIRPSTTEKQWYKFDDEKVQKVRERDAVDENYGGTEDKKSKYFWLQSNSIAKKFTNAYMLVYIKTSEIENMLAPVGPEEVPEHLKLRVEKEREESEKRKKEKAEAHKFVNIRVATDKDLKQNVGTDLVTSWETIEPIKIKKSATLLELKHAVQAKTNIPAERQRFWKWESRQNRTYRPDSPIRESMDGYPLEKLFSLSPTQADALNLYVEESKAPEGADAFIPFEKDHCLIFIKFYDPASRTVQYVGTVNATLKDKVQDLLPAINNLLGLDPQTQLSVYEEVKPSMIEPVNMRATLKQAELQIGDILTVQTPFLTPEEQQSHEYPTAPDYYKYLTQRTLIRFRKLEEPKQEAFTEELLKSYSYAQIVTKLAEKLGTKPEFIRLTGNNPYSDAPRTMPFKSTEVKSLKDMIVLTQNSTDILYYEILSEPITEFETKKELNIQWYNNKVELVATHKLLVPKEETVADVIERLKQKVEISDPNAEIRIMEIFCNRIHKVIQLEANIDDIGSGALDLRAEEIPAEEKSLDQAKGRLIQVVHFCKEGSGVRLFGAPFVFVLNTNETLVDVKKRIQEKLGVKEEEFKKYKFAPISTLSTRCDPIGDEDIVAAALEKADTLKQHTVCLGMEHWDPTPRATTRWYDKPIVIKN